jgi:hypothetical protein
MDGVLWIEIACIAKDWALLHVIFRNSRKRERWGLGNQNQKEEGVGVLYYCKVV